MSAPDLVDLVLSELGDVGTTVGEVTPEGRAMASLRVAILVEQVLGLALTDAELNLDLTDRAVLRRVLGPSSASG